MVGERWQSKLSQFRGYQRSEPRNDACFTQGINGNGNRNLNVENLIPKPSKRESFRRSRERFLPQISGCYVITTFDGTILYIGLSVGIRRRMVQHLDTPAKVSPTPLGRATWFYWLETSDTNKVERTWLNMHLAEEGVLPILNSIYSPTAT